MRPPICLDAEVRPVPGWPGLAVSAAGAVYGPRGLRKAQPGTDSYLYVSVRRPGRRGPAKLRVHVAVLLAWVGPRPEGTEGRHLNGDSMDNRASNLEWATHAVNEADKERHGTRPRGAASVLAKLTEADVRAMRAAWPAATYSELGRRFGVSKDAARLVVLGRRWAHLSREEGPEMARTAMQARPTQYKGIQMRSRMEAEFAAQLDRTVEIGALDFRCAQPWQYEPMCFASPAGQYLPDFSLEYADAAGELLRMYIETKPVVDDPKPIARRMEIIWASEPAAVLALFELRGQRRTWTAFDREWWLDVPGEEGVRLG